MDSTSLFNLQIKENDKGSLKKKNTWPVFELQVVDGKDENKVDIESSFGIVSQYRKFFLILILSV